MELPNIFLTWEWVTTWIEHFGDSYETFILMGYENDELVSILPFARKRMRLEDGFLKLQVITFCGALELYPDHLDIICNKNTPYKTINTYITEFVEFIYRNHYKFGFFYLPYLAEDGFLSRWIQEHIKEQRILEGNDIRSPYISIEGDINTYFQSFGKKKRYNLKREAKILFEQKKVSLTCLVNEDEVTVGLQDLHRLHSARSYAKGIESTFSNDKIMKYHSGFAKKAVPLNWIRIFQLKENSTVIASAYGFLFQQRFNYYQTGFDPEWSTYSPGNILIYSMLETLSSNGISEFDFLGGNDAYKLFWTKKNRLMKTYMIFNRGLGPRLEYFLLKKREQVKGIMKKSVMVKDLLKDRIMNLKIKSKENSTEPDDN
jgi:hypothetical protein